MMMKEDINEQSSALEMGIGLEGSDKTKKNYHRLVLKR